MADSPASPNPNDTGGGTDPEAEFWKKHRENTVGILNEWWETHKPADPPKPDTKTGDTPKPDTPPPGTSRTGGKRVTLPGLIADMVFGPNKD